MLRLALVLVCAAIASPLLNAHAPGRAFVVASGSMEPAIPTGALAVATPGEPAVGDVVVYRSPVGANQIHRVYKVEEREGVAYYFTKGDANDGTDSFAVPREDVLGVVAHHVAYVGFLWMIPPAEQAALFAAFVLAYLALTCWDARHLLRARKATTFAVLAVLALLVPVATAGVDSVFGPSDLAAAVATTPLPLAAGTMGSAVIASDLNGATATVGLPKLWGEVVLWGCAPAGTCNATAPALTYGTTAGSIARLNAADYTPVPTFYFEATLTAPAGQTIYAQLFDKTGGAAVAGTEVSTTSTTPVTLRSAGFALSGDKEYQFQSKNSGLTAAGSVGNVRVVASQEYATATASQVRLSGAAETTTTASFTTPARAGLWRYEGSSYDGVAGVFFEAVGQVAALQTGAGEVRLLDTSNSSEAAKVSFATSATSATRVRSADLSGALVDGREYKVEFKAGAGVAPKLTLHLARMVVVQTSFTKTVRYVDLSWTATSTSTSFLPVGYPGRYHMDTEWGSLTGYFEATLNNTGGGTSSARLYDEAAGAAVASSQVDVTGTAYTRARSGAVSLSTANVTYAAQVQASAGTVEVRNAWLIVFQADGKTFDHVLKSRNDAVDACTWTFRLQYTSGTDLARITKATLSLRGATTQDQIVVSSGSVTQSTGTGAAVAFGSQAQHLVTTRPASAGSSTVNADLLGTCQGYGIHTSQPVSYTLN